MGFDGHLATIADAAPARLSLAVLDCNVLLLWECGIQEPNIGRAAEHTFSLAWKACWLSA